ncbi:hypothetical protein D5S17_11425 [Pseudonocardiaceae bacterium YIM PH 21723]|nr:hypothetical protein D5S17_11425 [Pseudonocardiaceae bacterium YIM PH 21723]
MFHARLGRVIVLAAVAAVALLVPTPQPAGAATNPIVDQFQSLTANAAKLLPIVEKIEETSPATPNLAQKVLFGLNDMAATAQNYVGFLQGRPPVTDPAEAKAIAAAHNEYVLGMRKLLTALSGKVPALQPHNLVVPVSAVLRNLEAATDSHEFTVLDIVQDPAAHAGFRQDNATLKAAIETAIQAYS